jgi:hypothetical protein
MIVAIRREIYRKSNDCRLSRVCRQGLAGAANDRASGAAATEADLPPKSSLQLNPFAGASGDAFARGMNAPRQLTG